MTGYEALATAFIAVLVDSLSFLSLHQPIKAIKGVPPHAAPLEKVIDVPPLQSAFFDLSRTRLLFSPSSVVEPPTCATPSRVWRELPNCISHAPRSIRRSAVVDSARTTHCDRALTRRPFACCILAYKRHVPHRTPSTRTAASCRDSPCPRTAASQPCMLWDAFRPFARIFTTSQKSHGYTVFSLRNLTYFLGLLNNSTQNPQFHFGF